MGDIARRGGVEPDAPTMDLVRGCRWAEAMAVTTGDPAWALAAGVLWGMALGVTRV